MKKIIVSDLRTVMIFVRYALDQSVKNFYFIQELPVNISLDWYCTCGCKNSLWIKIVVEIGGMFSGTANVGCVHGRYKIYSISFSFISLWQSLVHLYKYVANDRKCNLRIVSNTYLCFSLYLFSLCVTAPKDAKTGRPYVATREVDNHVIGI